jgi:ribonuclease III
LIRPMNPKIDNLCGALGYTFKDKELLLRAVSHKSTGKESNERLEFLGDAVLNFVIASTLFQNFPKMREGELTRLRANLVNGETLADLARQMSIGDCLVLGAGEIKSGGAERDSILADTFEAIIGAIYLDSGIEICTKHLLRWYKKLLQNVSILAPKDAKTKLQEFLQSHKLSLPVYSITAIAGDPHKQTFHVECRVSGVSEIGVGVASTKRKAEQQAAERLLQVIEND